MPNKSRCCNPFCCFSACAQTAPSESGPGPSHDVADVSGVPRCDKAPPSGSSDVDARLNVSGPPRCDDASSSGSSNVPKTRSEEEDVDVNLNASGAPPCINEASTSGSSNVPNTRSEEEDADVNLNVSGASPCINEATTSGSSNVPNRSEEQDVDFNLNVSGDPRCINEAPSCSSSSGATKSRSDLISSIRKDIVEVEDVNLDALTNHISELLKLREEGKQQQASNLRKFPWPNVPGLQKLKEIVSYGTDLQQLQNMGSSALTFGSEAESELEMLRDKKASNPSNYRWPEGFKNLNAKLSWGTDLKNMTQLLSSGLDFASILKEIISGPVKTLLREIGQASVATAGLLVIAYSLERFEELSTNKEERWDILKEMSYLASVVTRLKQSPKGTQEDVIEETTLLIAEGAIMCCSQIASSPWKKFFLSSKNKADLSEIRQKLNNKYMQINLEIGFRVLTAIERQGRSPLSKRYPSHAVGINEPIKEILHLLELESKEKVVTVILHGFGGMGKTTLADAVFAQVVGCRYSHVQLFKDIDSKPDIVKLQKDILKDLMEPEESVPEIRKYQDGQEVLKERLGKIEALIYIDNVLEGYALKNLLPSDMSTAKKVRLLLTARNEDVKKACPLPCKEPKIYKMEGIKRQEAKLILKKEIEDGINDTQFDEIIEMCGNIPLMLTLAAPFIGRADNKQEAFSTLMLQKDKWTAEDFKEMRYAFAYDALPRECKAPFLDICSYFKGWKWDIVQDIVGQVELRMLESRALVTKATTGVASVHDVILTLARQKSEEESNGKEVRKTFTRARELKKFLEEEDTQGIKGIWLARDYDDALHICASRLDSMHNSLRVLHLETPTKVEGNCNKIFKELIYLKANIIQLPFRVSQLKQLRYLSCEFPQNLPRSLELMNFDGRCQCRAFQVLSTDFIQLRNLRVLKFNKFTKLKELPKELGKLVSLRVLELIACGIRKLPDGFGQLKNLEELDLEVCDDLTELCNDLRELASLRVLKLDGCSSIRKLPEGLDQLKNLKELVLRTCRNLTELRNDFSSLSLQTLDLRECDRLEQFAGDGSCPSTDISVQALSISESQKENIENNVLSEFDRILTDGLGEPFHLSHLPPNTPVLVICDTRRLWLRPPNFPWQLIKETIDETQIIYIGPHVRKLPRRIRDRIFVIPLPSSRVQKVLKQVCLTLDAAVPSSKNFGYLQMHTKTVGEKSDNYRPCWRFLTEGELEEFVVCNSGRYVRLKQLQAARDEESSNIEMLRELFAPDGDETTPVFQKKDSSGQVTTCGVDQLKGKTILLDLRSEQLFDDIGLPSLKEMYDVVVKDKLDLEIISIPITSPVPYYFDTSRYIGHEHLLREVPWFVFQSGTRVIRKVALFFLTKQCGWEEGDECEKWYASINCIIEPNGRVIPCRPFTKYTEAKSTPILEFLFNHLERASDQVKRIMFQVKWGVKACPTVHEEIENFKKEEWEQLKSMSTLEFLFNHLESTSDQVKKLMCQGKIICLRSGYQYDGCAQLMNEMDQFKKGIHVITMGDTRMERLLLTDTIYKNCHKLYTIPDIAEMLMSSINLSSHEHMIFSSRLHYLKEEINRIEESDKKLSELKSVLHSFQDESSMTFMDQYGKLVATLGANNIKLIFQQGKKHRAPLFITSMMKDIEGGGKEMHDKDPGFSDSLIQNMQTASTSVAVEQEDMDAYFESLLEYISELWAVELYQLFKFNKDGKKSSPSRVTWPDSRGFCMLENLLSKGTDADWVKDVISRHPEEDTCEPVIKSLLKDIEEENWGVAGLLGVAYVLERFESVSANQIEQCLLVLDEMLRVAQYIKQFNEKPELSWRRGKRVATVSMVICSIACSSLIDPSKFALFELATVDNLRLRGIQYELEWIGNNIANAITEGLDGKSGSGLENMCHKFDLFFETSW